MTTPHMRWTMTLTALSSISHTGEVSGTEALFRREAVISPTGERVEVPVVSGNALRGALRRVGEDLLRDELELGGEISLPAASALRGGGTLTRSSTTPLTGARLGQVRSLVPNLSVFGAALGSVIVDGCLRVGKVYPWCAETSRITGVESAAPAALLTQLESYSRLDDAHRHGATVEVGDAQTTGPMRFQVETLPAGTVLSTWVRLDRPTPLEAGFFASVLEAWCADAHLGGRRSIGHGQVRVELTADPASAGVPVMGEWAKYLRERRGEVLEALGALA